MFKKEYKNKNIILMSFTLKFLTECIKQKMN